jgi:hypothetical protein
VNTRSITQSGITQSAAEGIGLRLRFAFVKKPCRGLAKFELFEALITDQLALEQVHVTCVVAKDAGRMVLLQNDLIALGKDLERVLDGDIHRLPQFNGDDDPPQIIQFPYYAGRFHSNCLLRIDDADQHYFTESPKLCQCHMWEKRARIGVSKTRKYKESNKFLNDNGIDYGQNGNVIEKIFNNSQEKNTTFLFATFPFGERYFAGKNMR